MGLLALVCAFVAPRLVAYPAERLGLHAAWLTTGLWPVLGVTILGAGILACVAARAGLTRWWNWNMLVAFLVYPIALGVGQQFLMLSYINVRLEDLGVPAILTALVTSTVFMSIHTEKRFWLATGAMGCTFSLLFQWQPNLFLFSISHGWLATLFYYWVLREDAIAETLPWVDKLLNGKK